MPWCDSCSQYHAPTALDGEACPQCGETVTSAPDRQGDGEERIVGESAPWHFWVVVALLIAYIVWRIIEFAREVI